MLKRYSEFYNTKTIKQYMAGDRRTRQFIVMAAREQKLTPTLEGGLDFKKNLTEAMDGYVGQRAHAADRAALQGRRHAADASRARRGRRR